MIELHIEVANLNKSLDLYQQILPHKRIEFFEDKKAVVLVLNDGAAFGLWETGRTGIHNGRAASHLHFAFDIEADELEIYRTKLQKLGLEVFDHSWGENWNSIYFFDYDGHQGEFITGGWK